MLSCPAECGLRLPYLKFLSLRHSYCASSSSSYSFTMTLMLGASSWRPQPTSLLAFSAVAPASSVSEEYSFVVDVVIVYIDALRSIVICLLDLHDACHEYFSSRFSLPITKKYWRSPINENIGYIGILSVIENFFRTKFREKTLILCRNEHRFFFKPYSLKNYT